MRDEHPDVFERAAQPSRSRAQVVERLTVETAFFRAAPSRFERRDAFVDQSGGPGTQSFRGRLSRKNVWDRVTSSGEFSPRG